MFTFIGPILIAVNPYQSLPIFTKEFIKLYYDQVQSMPRFLYWKILTLGTAF